MKDVRFRGLQYSDIGHWIRVLKMSRQHAFPFCGSFVFGALDLARRASEGKAGSIQRWPDTVIAREGGCLFFFSWVRQRDPLMFRVLHRLIWMLSGRDGGRGASHSSRGTGLEEDLLSFVVLCGCCLLCFCAFCVKVRRPHPLHDPADFAVVMRWRKGVGKKLHIAGVKRC